MSFLMNALRRLTGSPTPVHGPDQKRVQRVWRKRRPHKANPHRLRPALRAALGRIRSKNIRPRFPRWARGHRNGWRGYWHARSAGEAR